MSSPMNARQILRWLWINLLAASGCLWWLKRKLRAEGSVVALVLHRVMRDRDYAQTCSQPEILVREQTFRELAAYVAREYQAVDLHDALAGAPSQKLKIVFTFDDGWWDNYAVLLPIAQEHNIPLTIFICPELVGKSTPFWPERVIGYLHASRPDAGARGIDAMIESLKKLAPQDREQQLARLEKEANRSGAKAEVTAADSAKIDRTLSWQEIQQMDRAGVRFGSHTRSHEILTAVSDETARQQVEGTDAAIAQVLGKACTAFSYPNGNWSAAARSIVADAGFKLAVTADRQIWTADCDPLAIPRSNVYEEDLVGLSGRFSPAMFEYATIWKAWRRSKLNARRQPEAQTKPTPVTL
jgi:peptidoglycan/xylan/chitin deacetylase (PgdA/CDA1 family)